MTLILRAIATAVVLGLLLPLSFQTETKLPEDTDEALKEKLQNKENSLKNSTEEKKYLCLNTTEISFSKLCDGYFDCSDGSDEMCESSSCPDNKCVCANTYSTQCVSKNNKFHSVIYQGYFSQLNINSTNPMFLECQLISYYHTKEINWYLNDRGVPKKCQITKSKRASWLYCPNMTIEDQGVYSCEQLLDFLYKINTMVTVKDESTRKMEPSCYCFDATNDCQTIKTNTAMTKNIQLFSKTPHRIHLNITNEGKTITKCENKDSSQLKAEDTVYYELSEVISNRKLNLYGGSLTYPTYQAVISENSPLALMRGDDKELIYYESGKSNKNSLYKRISFSKGNWYRLQENSVSNEEASEVDVMKVLNNLDGIYIRVYYAASYDRYDDNDNEVTVYSKAELAIMKFDEKGLSMSSIAQCSCPPEYAGTYCERRADNYIRNSQENNSFIQQSQSNLYLSESMEDSKSFLHLKPGNSLILEYPNSNGFFLEEINWYRNDRGVPNKCLITHTPESNTLSRLQCPNMTTADEGVYVGDQRDLGSVSIKKQFVVFVKKESSFEPDACFCFGSTTPKCQKTNVTFEDEAIELFSESAHPVLLKTVNEGKTVHLDEMIFKDKDLQKILEMKFNGTLFYALSEKIISKKLKLYGGSLSFQLSYPFDNKLINDENSPLALMRGDNKVLVYYESRKSDENSRYKRLSFSKYDWSILHENNVSEKAATEADVLKVLNNLETIYVKQLSVVHNYERAWTKVELSTVKFVNNGSGVPSSIGKCSCPSGYAGTYCEKRADNYTESSTKKITNAPIIQYQTKNYSTTIVVKPKESQLTTPRAYRIKYEEIPRHDFSYDNETAIDSLPESLSGSSPIPSQFFLNRVDCLTLYFFSLCCSILWFRFI